MEDPVLVEHRDGFTIITINRPQAKNAVNRAVTLGIAAAVDELEARPEQVLGIRTGAGGTFCAGMDLKAFVAGENVSLPVRRQVIYAPVIASADARDSALAFAEKRPPIWQGR